MYEIDTKAVRLILSGDAAIHFVNNPVKIAATELRLYGVGAADLAAVTSIKLPKFPKLTVLTIVGWPQLISLDVQSRIKTLLLDGCERLETVEPLALKKLTLRRTPLRALSGSLGAVREIDTDLDRDSRPLLEELGGLLTMRASLDFEDLSVFPSMKVNHLELSGRLTSLNGIGVLTKVKRLKVDGSQLTDISALSAISVHTIDFQGCLSLRDISVFKGRKLRSIDLRRTKVRPEGVPLSLVPMRSPSPIKPQSLVRRVVQLEKEAKEARELAKKKLVAQKRHAGSESPQGTTPKPRPSKPGSVTPGAASGPRDSIPKLKSFAKISATGSLAFLSNGNLLTMERRWETTKARELDRRVRILEHCADEQWKEVSSAFTDQFRRTPVACAASPKGSVVAAGYKTVALYAWPSMKKVGSLKGVKYHVGPEAIGFSPSGRRVVVAGGGWITPLDRTVRVYDTDSGAPVAKFLTDTGHHTQAMLIDDESALTLGWSADSVPTLTCTDVSTGEARWRQQMPGLTRAEVDLKAGRVWLSGVSGDGASDTLLSLDTAEGSVIDSITFGAGRTLKVWGAIGRTLILNLGGGLVAKNLDSGEVRLLVQGGHRHVAIDPVARVVAVNVHLKRTKGTELFKLPS